MKILFQEVYLASGGGYLHVRVVSGVPPLNLRVETMLSDSAITVQTGAAHKNCILAGHALYTAS